MIGSVEADPEYQLIVDSNNLIVEIDNEISKYIRGDVKPSVPGDLAWPDEHLAIPPQWW